MFRRFSEILLKVLTTRAAWPVLLAVGLLCTASIFALQLSSPERAEKQQIHILIGLGVLLLALIPHYQHIGRISYIFLGVVAILLVAVLFTPRINGSRRWFNIGGAFQLQPSELAKLAYVLSLAWYLRYRRNIAEFSGLLVPLGLMLIPFGLIVIEPDLGTALLFPTVTFAMLIAAGARLRHLAFLGMMALFAIPTFYPLIPQYAKARLLAMLPSVQADPVQLKGPLFQAFMSWVAIGSGGLTGDVDGADHIRQGILPEAYTDFIFSCIGAEWGFVGCITIIVLYLAFFAAAIEIAAATKDQFARLVVVGLSSIILVQAIINMAMTMGLAPVVGVALPFVSYGGSSLLTNMLAAGILLNISVRRSPARTLARADYAMA